MDTILNKAVGLDGGRGYSTAASGAKRTGEAGGFKEFDREEDERRKRRAYEQSMQKAERKAEKKKCQCAPPPRRAAPARVPSPATSQDAH